MPVSSPTLGAMTTPAAGWYPDPSGDSSKLRYWDGANWTEHFAPAQQAAAPPSETSGQPGIAEQAPAAEPSTAEAHGPTDHGGYGQGEQQPGLAAQESAGEGDTGGDEPTRQFAPTAQEDAAQASPEDASHGFREPATQPFQEPATQAYQEPVTPPYAAVGQQQSAHQTQPYGQQPYGDQQAYSAQQPYGTPQEPYGTQQPYGAQQQPYAQHQPAPQQPYAAGATPYGASAAQTKKGGAGTLIGIIIAVLVLLGAIGVGVWMLLKGDDDGAGPGPETATTAPTNEPTTDAPTSEPPSAEPTQPERPGGGGAASGDTIELNSTVAGSLAAEGSWVAQLEIDELTPVLIDVRATDDSADLEVRLRGNGVELHNDDRDFLDITGSWRDPALVAVLEPGSYEIAVSEWYDDSGEFEIAVLVPERVEIGESIEISLSEDEGWYAAVTIEEAGSYVFDTVSEDGDAEMLVTDGDGVEEYSDDTDNGDGAYRDPHLTIDLEPGVYFVFLNEWWNDPLEITLMVEQR